MKGKPQATGSLEAVRVAGKTVSLVEGTRYAFALDEAKFCCPVCGGKLVDADIDRTGVIASVCARCNLWFS